MNEKEFRKALLQLDAAGAASAPNAAQLSKDILSRDRRCVQLLTGLTISTWLLAGVVILFVLAAFVFTIIPHVKTLTQDIEAGNLTSQQTVGILHTHTLMFLKSAILIALSVFIMALAALLTILLIFVSRRATLRQITANLAELSEQLKRLHPDLSKCPPEDSVKPTAPPPAS